jgi:hypothetical protein
MATESWLAVALRRDIFARSVRIALVVGSLLALINHGERIISGSLDSAAMVKICLTYLVPFGVATWSAVNTVRSEQS